MAVALSPTQKLTTLFTEIKTEFAKEEQQIQVAIRLIHELPSPKEEPKDTIKIGLARHQLHQQFPTHKNLKALSKEVYDFLRYLNEQIDEREQALSNGAFNLQTAEGNTGIGDLLTFGNYYFKRELENAELVEKMALKEKQKPEVSQEAASSAVDNGEAPSAEDIEADYDELEEFQQADGEVAIKPDYRLRVSVEVFDACTAPALRKEAKEKGEYRKADEAAAVKIASKPKSPGIKQVSRKSQY